MYSVILIHSYPRPFTVKLLIYIFYQYVYCLNSCYVLSFLYPYTSRRIVQCPCHQCFKNLKVVIRSGLTLPLSKDIKFKPLAFPCNLALLYLIPPLLPSFAPPLTLLWSYRWPNLRSIFYYWPLVWHEQLAKYFLIYVLESYLDICWKTVRPFYFSASLRV